MTSTPVPSVPEAPTLYHNDMSACSAKVRMALEEKHIKWESVHLNLRKGETQTPEYIRLNPRKLVPTLVHRGVPIIESNVICEYIEEVWKTPELRPDDPLERARMRLWMKQLDEDVHAAMGIVSTCISHRHQHLERDPAEFRAWLDNIPDVRRREMTLVNVQLGMDSPHFLPAVARFDKLLRDFDEALRHSSWLLTGYSLVDLSFAPYLIRLKLLGFDRMFDERPRVADWAARLFSRTSFREGIEKWFNPAVLELFDRERDAVRKRLTGLPRSSEV